MDNLAASISTKSVVKNIRKSDAAILPAVDVVKLNFGQLIDLSLGQTEDSRNYGAVSFGLLRELLIAIVDRLGTLAAVIQVNIKYASTVEPEIWCKHSETKLSEFLSAEQTATEN